MLRTGYFKFCGARALFRGVRGSGTVAKALLCVLVFAQLTSSSFGATNVVLVSGAASPDGNGTISAFSAPALNSSGQLAFVGQLSGTTGGSADDHALFELNSGTLIHIARKGQMINGRSVVLFFAPYIDASGTVCDVPALGSPSTFTNFFSTGGPLTLMYTPGSSSPSGNNTLLGVTSAAVNDAGNGAYLAAYSGANPEVGLYSRSAGGAVNTLVTRNSAAPRGGTFSSLGTRLSLNESGSIAGLFSLSGTTSTKTIVRSGASGTTELVRRGDLLGDGITTVGDFSTVSYAALDPIPLIDDSGQVAFSAQYTQSGAPRFGVFVADDAGARLVAPWALPQGNMDTINVVGISSAGTVAFNTEFTGGADPSSAIYLAGPSGQTLVALEDTATPVAGRFFRSFFSTQTSLNSAGQLAFEAELSDTANGAADGKGVFFYDTTGGLKQIARVGDSFAGSTISDLSFSGTVLNSISVQSPDTSLSGLNGAGKVAFSFTLANGQSGIAIWSAGNIPGDYNGDSIVDGQDYNTWCAAYGTNSVAADGNGNGVVDAADYVVWRAALGHGAAAAMKLDVRPVPEPAVISLLLSVGAAFAYRRSRRDRISECFERRLIRDLVGEIQ